MSSSSVGLIGAGLLGQSIAHCLLQSNETVTGFDIDQQRCLELAEQGAETVNSATDVCQQCRRIFLSLPDSTVVSKVIEEIRSQLQTGDIIIDTTTGNPRHTRQLCQSLAEEGIFYLDATIVGSSVQVRSQEALMLIGGDASAVSDCQPLLETISDHTLHLGPSGAGATMKLVVNLVLGLNRAVLAEGLSLGESCGLEPAPAAKSGLLWCHGYQGIKNDPGRLFTASSTCPTLKRRAIDPSVRRRTLAKPVPKPGSSVITGNCCGTRLRRCR